MVKHEAIKFFADYQRNWAVVIPPLKRGGYVAKSTDKLSIHGDAPKSFIRIREYVGGRSTADPARWPAHIAKVGSKWYPMESVTEHLITRIGQILGFSVADSQLRMVKGQVRFLSRYFLSSKESLVHGIEIFRDHLDIQMVEEIAQLRAEQDFYTFQSVCAAMKESFPGHHDQIMSKLVEMLAFDAIVGNNDRHPANWGVIVPIAANLPPRFSPVFDSARALFWNNDERKVRAVLQSEDLLCKYVERSRPQIGWDHRKVNGHFDLIGLIHEHYPAFRRLMNKFTDMGPVDKACEMLNEEFGNLLSQERRMLIGKCIKMRHGRFCHAMLPPEATGTVEL